MIILTVVGLWVGQVVKRRGLNSGLLCTLRYCLVVCTISCTVACIRKINVVSLQEFWQVGVINALDIENKHSQAE
jgi:hypothetical protein